MSHSFSATCVGTKYGHRFREYLLHHLATAGECWLFVHSMHIVLDHLALSLASVGIGHLICFWLVSPVPITEQLSSVLWSKFGLVNKNPPIFEFPNKELSCTNYRHLIYFRLTQCELSTTSLIASA